MLKQSLKTNDPNKLYTSQVKVIQNMAEDFTDGSAESPGPESLSRTS